MAPPTSALIPANPSSVMAIRSIHPAITTLSVPFNRHGKIAVGGRATLVRLSKGPLAVFSPVALTSEVRAAIADLSKAAEPAAATAAVGYIVAPDLEHHIFVSEWKRAFPAAKIIGPAGLYEKRKAQTLDKKTYPNVDDNTFFKPLREGDTSVGDEAFDTDFETQVMHTTPNTELAFLHKASKTLIQADLMFNLPPNEQYSRVPEAERPRTGFSSIAAVANSIFYHVARTEGADLTWPRRFIWYGIAGKDKEGFARGIQRIDGWDFENVIPSHGDSMLGDGKERFRRLFAWQLQHEKKE